MKDAGNSRSRFGFVKIKKWSFTWVGGWSARGPSFPMKATTPLPSIRSSINAISNPNGIQMKDAGNSSNQDLDLSKSRNGASPGLEGGRPVGQVFQWKPQLHFHLSDPASMQSAIQRTSKIKDAGNSRSRFWFVKIKKWSFTWVGGWSARGPSFPMKATTPFPSIRSSINAISNPKWHPDDNHWQLQSEILLFGNQEMELRLGWRVVGLWAKFSNESHNSTSINPIQHQCNQQSNGI